MQFKPFAVPQSFSFIDPDTGFAFQAESKEQLIKHIVTYRVQNRLPPIEHLGIIIENYLCSKPVNRLNCTGREMPKGWKVILKKGLALLRFMKFRNFADQATADLRSEVCVGCPLNQKPVNKPFYERWAAKAAEEVIEDRKSKNHDKLMECQACGCNLRAKVWTGDAIELFADEHQLIQIQRPQCWQINSKKLKVLREEGPA